MASDFHYQLSSSNNLIQWIKLPYITYKTGFLLGVYIRYNSISIWCKIISKGEEHISIHINQLIFNKLTFSPILEQIIQQLLHIFLGEQLYALINFMLSSISHSYLLTSSSSICQFAHSLIIPPIGSTKERKERKGKKCKRSVFDCFHQVLVTWDFLAPLPNSAASKYHTESTDI